MSTWLLFDYLGEKEPVLTEERIVKYLEGDSLLSNVLKDFKENWDNQRPKIKNNQNVFSKFKSVFFGGENSNDLDSTEFKAWKLISQRINTALKARDLLDDFKFTDLDTVTFFKEEYLDIVRKIDSAKYDEIANSLNDKRISQLPVKDAFSVIEDTYNQLKNPIKKDVGQKNDNDRNHETPVVNETSTTNAPASNINANSNTESSKTSGKVSRQEEFEKAFWKLVNSGNAEMDKYKALYNKYKAMKGEELDYLNKIQKNSEAFEMFKIVPEVKRKNAQSISDLENK